MRSRRRASTTRLITFACFLLFVLVPNSARSGAVELGQATSSTPASAVDREDSDKLTALMRASAKGDVRAVNDLIAKGANVNAKSSDSGVTALMFAAYWGELPVVNALLAKSADVGQKDSGDRTAIDYAATGGQRETANLLQGKGARLKPSSGGVGAFLDVGTMPLKLLEKASGKPLPK